MDVEFSSAKKNRGWMSGLPTDNPRALFGTIKTVPGFVKWTKNVHVLGA